MAFGRLQGPGFGEQMACWQLEFNKIRSEGCGICEDGNVLGESFILWFTDKTRGAHLVCHEKIRHLDEKLTKTIRQLFYNNQLNESENSRKFNQVHREAIKAIKIACGSETILSYLEKNGETRLTHLFQTVGIEAIKQLAKKQMPAKL